MEAVRRGGFTMNITPGFWRTRNGNKAEVVDVRYCFAIGWLCDGTHKWNSDGISSLINDYNLVEPWVDKPEWDWSKTLPWINWLAMDQDGIWYLFGTKPDLRSTTWFTVEGAILNVHRDYAPKWRGNWKDSLVGRPGVEVTP